jgi:hypothetical protein
MNILQILKLVSEDVDSEWQAVLEFLFPMGHVCTMFLQEYLLPCIENPAVAQAS